MQFPHFSREQLMKNRVPTLFVSALLFLLSGGGLFFLKFEFDFEQFFPQGDPDLAFFQEFIEEFETDDNFLLVGVERQDGIFDSLFLSELGSFSKKTRELPHVTGVNGLLQWKYPVKTPFGITAVPGVHADDPAFYPSDRKRILEDPRLAGFLINDDATGTVLVLKLINSIGLEDARELMTALESLVSEYHFEKVHYLGRPNFQTVLVDMQKREVIVSSGVAAILVFLAMFFIFRKTWTIVIAMTSIALALLFFFGFLGWTGRPLNAMAALYPVLMIIVGTSDVIHILTKFQAELRKGLDKWDAWTVTVRQIGLATLLTSLTTAVGFASLFTSRIGPIREFGLNAAIGVGIAYLTVIFFTGAALLSFEPGQILSDQPRKRSWEGLMQRTNVITRKYSRAILIITGLFLMWCFWGISQITTNYRIEDQMPRNSKITEDFLYFEEEFTGFRPYELAVQTAPGHRITDYDVLREMDRVETYLKEQPLIRSVQSVTDVYRSIRRMENQNRVEAYRFPEDSLEFARQSRYTRLMPREALAVLVSSDSTKGRISARVADAGADEIREMSEGLFAYIRENSDSSLVHFRLTGTGVIVDKNAQYVRESLVWGLGLALIAVSILMALLFRQAVLLIIALIPNLVPLIFAGAVLGWLGIELEAGISIVFAIVFGIAVDDTIHFLSKYKLIRQEGYTREAAIATTFAETGKAIVLTSLILFFGFLVLFFSIHPPSVIVGLLISITLLSALVADLFLLPICIRLLIRDDSK